MFINAVDIAYVVVSKDQFSWPRFIKNEITAVEKESVANVSELSIYGNLNWMDAETF